MAQAPKVEEQMDRDTKILQGFHTAQTVSGLSSEKLQIPPQAPLGSGVPKG